MSRLDLALAERGLAPSRSLAARLIRAGAVSVNGRVETKPSCPVSPEDEILCQEAAESKYVSRGGLKLEAALEEFSLSAEGKLCADVGASTGGFTHCLLSRGAKRVYAVDAGKNQLHPRLKNDPRVISMEQVNARYLTGEEFEKVDLVVADLSFISLTLVFDAFLTIMKPDAHLLCLIKPQFELSREKLGRGGIVKKDADRALAVARVKAAAEAAGLALIGLCPSPIEGGDGNREFLALWKKAL